MTGTRWNRHRGTCTGTTSTGKACVGCESGSADRMQRKAYAYAVTVALTGGTCPLTGQAFSPVDGEVDRVDSARGYVPGNVVLVSVAGNQGRSTFQSTGQDIPGATRYAADVARASESVTVPTLTDAARTVRAWGKADYRAAVENGPYGR